MYVWVLPTLLIGTQTLALARGEQEQNNLFLDFHVNRSHRNDFILKNGYGSDNEFRWDISSIGSSTINDIDKTVGNVLRNFLTPSSYASMQNVKLKNGYGSNNVFHWNVSAIGSSILNDIKQLSRPFGIEEESDHSEWPLITTTPHFFYASPANATRSRWNGPSFVDSIYYELFRFPARLLPLANRTFSKIREYSGNNDYIGKGYIASEFQSSNYPKHSKTPSGLMTPIIIKNVKHYVVGARQCMSSSKSNFNLPKAVIAVMKYSPQDAATIVRNRFRKPVPRHPASKKRIYNGYEAMTCQAFTTTVPNYYECLKELRRIKTCVSDRRRRSAEPKALKDYHKHKFWPSTLRLVNSVSELRDNCQIDHKTSSVACTFVSRSRNDSIVGNHQMLSLSTSETRKKIQKMIEQVLRNQFGADILDEIGTCVYIYQRGAEAERKLRKMSRSQPRARQVYVEVSNNLETYQRHLMRIAIGAVNDIRSVFTTVEGTLVRSMSQYLGIDFPEHMKSMKCLDGWIDAMIEPWLGDGYWNDETSKPVPEQPKPEQPKPEQPKPEQPKPEQPKPEQPKPEQPLTEGNSTGTNATKSYEDEHYDGDEYSNETDDVDSNESPDENDGEFRRTYLQKGVIPREEATRKLMNSLKRLSLTKVLKKQSTIASLANTFLLATMFYECITVLAAAVYRTERNTVSESGTVPSTPIYQEMSTSRGLEQSWESE